MQIAGQTAEQAPKSPLSDLSFFRFPEVTPEIVRDIVLFLVALALTVVLTVIVQRWLIRRAERRRRSGEIRHRVEAVRLEPELRAVWERLLTLSGAADEEVLLHDAAAFETAVAAFAELASDAELAALHHLRQRFHLNAMNPEVALVSTRQLLRDLPVRVLASVAGEKLDLYCSVLDVNERELVLGLPPDDTVQRLLASQPQVLLVFWREDEGETVFRLQPEAVGREQLPLLRAAHALREPEFDQREAFRLTLDEPVGYTYLAREQVQARRRSAAQDQGPVLKGEGRLLDVSNGGASLYASEPLPARGFAQLRFELHGEALRLMMEVLSCDPAVGARYLVRGRFRGQGEAVHLQLANLLVREQIHRLREKTHILIPAQG